jgi:hypothetical protein
VLPGDFGAENEAEGLVSQGTKPQRRTKAQITERREMVRFFATATLIGLLDWAFEDAVSDLTGGYEIKNEDSWAELRSWQRIKVLERHDLYRLLSRHYST